MAETRIGKWSAAAVLDARQFSAGVDQMRAKAAQGQRDATKSFRGMEQEIEKTTGGIGASVGLWGMRFGFASAALGAAVGLMIGSVGNLKRVFEEEIDLAFLSDAVGSNIESITALRTVAAESGIAAEQFGSMVTRLTGTIGAAAQGSAEAQTAFRQLGLDWRSLRDQDFDRNFLELADAISKIESPAARARLAMDIFGRSDGPRFLRMAQEGAAGLAAELDSVRARGGFTTPADLEHFQRINALLDQAGTSWRNTWRDVIAMTAPWLASVAEALRFAITGRVPGQRTPEQEAAETARLDEENFLARMRRVLEGDESFRPTRDIPERFRIMEARRTVSGNVVNVRGAQINDEAVRAQLEANDALDRVVPELLASIEAREDEERGIATLNRQLDEFNEELRLTAATAGMSANMARFVRLEERARTDEQRAIFAERRRQLEELEAAEQRRAEAERQAAQQAADNTRLVQDREQQYRSLEAAARTPLENFEKEVQRIRGAGLSPDQEARLIGEQMRRLTVGAGAQSPLLGSLRSDDGEIGAILQAASAPQIDETNLLRLLAEQELTELREHTRLQGLALRFLEERSGINQPPREQSAAALRAANEQNAGVPLGLSPAQMNDFAASRGQVGFLPQVVALLQNLVTATEEASDGNADDMEEQTEAIRSVTAAFQEVIAP